MAALPVPDEIAARLGQQFTQGAIELRGHSGTERLGFTQRGDLQEQGGWIDTGVIVRQHVERHRRNLGEQFVQRRRVARGRDVVAVAGPDGGLVVPAC